MNNTLSNKRINIKNTIEISVGVLILLLPALSLLYPILFCSHIQIHKEMVLTFSIYSYLLFTFISGIYLPELITATFLTYIAMVFLQLVTIIIFCH